MPEPEDCTSLQEVRAGIDLLDHSIVQILGRRARYVRAAARFKTDDASVRAEDRLHTMLRQRRAWAAEVNLSPEMVERLYRDLVEYFIEQERQHWVELQDRG